MNIPELVRQILLALADASLKALLLLAAAGLLALAARGASARVRHLVWAFGLAGALALLPLSALAPDWVLPGLQLEAPFPAENGPAVSPQLREAALAATTSAPAVESPLALADDPLPTLGEETRAAPALPEPELLLLGLWALGLGACLIWKGAGLLRARAIVGRADAAQGTIAEELANAARDIGLEGSVRLKLSRDVRAPMTLGALRPTVLLPEAAGAWSEEERRLVLLHELVHVRRGDWLLKQLVHLAVAIYWWLPLAWIALRRFNIEQELSCDEAVLAHGAKPSEYAGLLLDMAASGGFPSPWPLPALDMARRSHMEGRLMAILETPPRRKSRLLTIPLLLVLGGLVPALALVHPWLMPEPFAPAVVEESEVASGANRARLSEIVREIDAAVEGIEAAAEEIDAVIEKRMEPIHEKIERRVEEHLEPYHAKIEAIHEEMEPFHEQMEAVLERMEPFHEKIEERALQIERLVEAGEYDSDRMRELEKAMQALEVELRPLEEELREFELRMHPFEERMEAVEVDMAPVEKELEALELEMAPIEAELEALEVKLAPFEAVMNELEDELEERLRAEVRSLVVTEVELSGLSASGEAEAIDTVTARVLDRSGIHIDDGVLSLGISIPRARTIINKAFEGRMPEENADRLAEALARFEVR